MKDKKQHFTEEIQVKKKVKKQTKKKKRHEKKISN